MTTMLASTHLSHPKYRPDIDGLRAIAVLSVVIFHAFPDSMRGGFIGVDIFFVISGFLISTIIFENLDKGTFSFTEFYVRRIRRIFPALLLVLAASMVFGLFNLLPEESKQLGKHIAAGAGFVSNFVLWSEAGYFDNSADTKPLLHLWSLGIEEQFYILWPLLLWLAWKRRFNLLTLTILVALASFALNIRGIKEDPVATFYSPQTRFWELLCGSMLAWFSLYRKEAGQTSRMKLDRWLENIIYREKAESRAGPSADILSLAGLLILLYGFWEINKGLSFPGKWALLPVLGAILVISAGPRAWANRTILSHKALVWFGLISYPLYLWHWPLLSFLRIVESETPSATMRFAMLVLSVALAWLTYKFVERPLRLGGNRRIKVFSLLALCLSVFLAGLLIHGSNLILPRASIKPGSELRLSRYDQRLSENSGYINEISTERQSAIRSPYCHMNQKNQSFEEYRQGLGECLKIIPGKMNVLIIGDSHAADFYLALSETHKDLNLLQMTGAGCTAIRSTYSDKESKCYKLIQHGIDFAVRNRLDHVVLASRWPGNFEELKSEITQLRDAGQQVSVVGPPAEFKEDVYKFISRRKAGEDLAALSARYFDREKWGRNEQMRTFSVNNGARFIDRISLLCPAYGVCELMDDDANLYGFDSAHLSRKGAQLLGRKILDHGYFRQKDKDRHAGQ